MFSVRGHTGSIWAKASWGTYWVWDDPRLVTFLIVLMLYAAYFVLRSSVEGERQLRYSAIYAIIAFASVPLSFYSVRIARSFVHPIVFTNSGANMPGEMLLWFTISQLAFLARFATVLQFELAQRRTEKRLRRASCPRGGVMSSGVEYVVASYGVMGFALLMYLVVAAMKRARLAREAELLRRLQRSRTEDSEQAAPSRNLESVDS